MGFLRLFFYTVSDVLDYTGDFSCIAVCVQYADYLMKNPAYFIIWQADSVFDGLRFPGIQYVFPELVVFIKVILNNCLVKNISWSV